MYLLLLQIFLFYTIFIIMQLLKNIIMQLLKNNYLFQEDT